MQITIANNNFELRDTILKRQAHDLSKVYDKRNRDELDDMEMMDEILKIVILRIDGNGDVSKFQEVFDAMRLEDYNELVLKGNDVMDGLKKTNNSPTSTKPSSTAEADGSPKNG